MCSYFNVCTMFLLLFLFQPPIAQTYIAYNTISVLIIYTRIYFDIYVGEVQM
jgi:hypothetical protein